MENGSMEPGRTAPDAPHKPAKRESGRRRDELVDEALPDRGLMADIQRNIDEWELPEVYRFGTHHIDHSFDHWVRSQNIDGEIVRKGFNLERLVGLVALFKNYDETKLPEGISNKQELLLDIFRGTECFTDMALGGGRDDKGGRKKPFPSVISQNLDGGTLAGYYADGDVFVISQSYIDQICDEKSNLDVDHLILTGAHETAHYAQHNEDLRYGELSKEERKERLASLPFELRVFDDLHETLHAHVSEEGKTSERPPLYNPNKEVMGKVLEMTQKVLRGSWSVNAEACTIGMYADRAFERHARETSGEIGLALSTMMAEALDQEAKTEDSREIALTPEMRSKTHEYVSTTMRESSHVTAKDTDYYSAQIDTFDYVRDFVELNKNSVLWMALEIEGKNLADSVKEALQVSGVGKTEFSFSDVEEVYREIMEYSLSHMELADKRQILKFSMIGLPSLQRSVSRSIQADKDYDVYKEEIQEEIMSYAVTGSVGSGEKFDSFKINSESMRFLMSEDMSLLSEKQRKSLEVVTNEARPLIEEFANTGNLVALMDTIEVIKVIYGDDPYIIKLCESYEQRFWADFQQIREAEAKKQEESTSLREAIAAATVRSSKENDPKAATVTRVSFEELEAARRDMMADKALEGDPVEEFEAARRDMTGDKALEGVPVEEEQTIVAPVVDEKPQDKEESQGQQEDQVEEEVEVSRGVRVLYRVENLVYMEPSEEAKAHIEREQAQQNQAETEGHKDS